MDAVLTAMVEEKIGPGERNRLLIQTAKEQLHFDYALALRSPAVAMNLALKAVIETSLNKDSQKAVIISALSPRYYLQVLQDLHLTPLYCDVSYDFPCMNRDLIENTISKKPPEIELIAIVLHHTLGFVPDSASIAELGFPVIEDLSQSYGNWFKPKEKKSGEKSDDAQTELTQTEFANTAQNKTESPKNELTKIEFNGIFCILGLEERDMLTAGGGALLFAMNRKDAAALRNFTGIADEYCLPDINSALAIVQFKDIERNLDKRRVIAEYYVKASMSTRHKRFIQSNSEYCNYSFPLVLETGLKDVIAYAKKKEIILENAFWSSIAGAGLTENCPVSNSLVLRTVLFPIYPRLRSVDAERISRLIMTLP